MLHALIVTSLLLAALPQAAAPGDGRGVLQVKVVLTAGNGTATPVPRHALLVSDDPPTAPPRRLLTTSDGTASIRLRPGRYLVESDQPIRFEGRAYQWTRIVEVNADVDTVLELTAANAEASDAADAAASVGRSLEADPSSVLIRWQDSVVAVWSPTARASGFVADARGLVVTTGRVAGAATSLEVEVEPAVKVASRVLVADAVRDVAVLWIDRAVAASVKPVPVGCGGPRMPALEKGAEIVAVEAPFRRDKNVPSGTVHAIEGRSIVADLFLGPGGDGGPVFAAGDRLVGMTALEEATAGRPGDPRVIRIEEVCAALAAAELRMKEVAAPDATRLPVEPQHSAMIAGVEAAAREARDLQSYRMSSSDYDITFITPALLHSARSQAQAVGGRRGGADPDPRAIDPLDDFSNWSIYVADVPAVLMIRVTPRLSEGFWTKVARGAALAQGMSLPPIKRFKPGFGRLQAFCGDTEVIPIHPFKLEQRVSETDAVYEGLYVFDPGTLGPSCGKVRLVLYSEKDPERGQSRIVEPDLLQRVAGDFAPSPAAPQVRPPADADFAKLSAAAEQARQAGRLDEAAPLYRQALALRTEWREGWWALGTILYDQDAHAEAARAFDRLVALDASNGTAHLMLALCEYQLDRNASAMEHIQAAKKLGVQKDGGLPNVLAYHEAMLLLRAERYERALDALQPLAAAGMDDENLDLALGMSVLLIRAQDAPAEGSDARRVVIQAGRAERHFLNKAFEAARSAWEALVRDWPAFPNLRYAFGRFLLDAGNLDAGIAEFQAEIANQPDHVRARMLIAAARYRVDSAAAIPFAREAVTLRPRYPFGHYLLGLLYLDVGEIDRAVAELETASRLVPTEPQFHFSLGSAYARAGRAEDAARARAAFSRLRKDDSAPQPDEAGTLRRLDLDEVPGAAPPSRKQP